MLLDELLVAHRDDGGLLVVDVLLRHLLDGRGSEYRTNLAHVGVEVVRGKAVEGDELELARRPRARSDPEHEGAEHVVLRGLELRLARGLGLEPVDLVEDLLEGGAGDRGGSSAFWAQVASRYRLDTWE